jgi:hypothetical protein
MNSHVRNGFSTVRPYVFGPHSILEFVETCFDGKVLVRLSPQEVNNPSDNLKTLFELPLLFYVMCLSTMALFFMILRAGASVFLY